MLLASVGVVFSFYYLQSFLVGLLLNLSSARFCLRAVFCGKYGRPSDEDAIGEEKKRMRFYGDGLEEEKMRSRLAENRI